MIPDIDIFYIFNGKEYISVEQYDKETKELEKEIERLKERISYLERSNDRREDTILGLREEIVEEQTKISKAIEYIKELTDDNESVELMDISFYVKGELLNILQGSDKE